MKAPKHKSALVGWVFSLAAAGVGAQQPQAPGTFRSGIVMIPVDVRVLDAQGHPVTDLAATDFTLLEGDVRQEIRHFSAHAHAEARPVTSGQSPQRLGPGIESSPVTHRTFLIVLGRGRLQGPAKGMDAVIDFVRTELLPQDRVAVIAYWRATELTADRASIIRLLERYRERHASIEGGIDHWRSDTMRLLYGSSDIPSGVRGQIDALFVGPGLPGVRRLSQRGFAIDSPGGGPPANVSSTHIALRPSVLVLLAAIEFLRYVEGEKHLVFLTQEGVYDVGRKAADRLAEMAADARVAVTVIQTAGVPLKWNPANLQSRGPWNSPRPPELLGRSFSQLWAVADARAIAEHTGGIASFYQYADRTLDHLNRATQFHYLLGYYPANGRWDGEYRSISVKVNRHNVTALYRHGYYAQQEFVPYNRRQVMVDERMAAAVGSRSEIHDIPVSLSVNPHSARDGELSLQLDIDPSRVTFTRDEEERYRVSLDVALFVGDARQKLIGNVSERLDIDVEGAAYARLLHERIVHSAKVRVVGRPRYVKAVVYDYEADRVGTAVQRLR